MSVQVVTEFPCHQSHAPSVVTQPRHFRDVRRLIGQKTNAGMRLAVPVPQPATWSPALRRPSMKCST
jgi:hypothetical protein